MSRTQSLLSYISSFEPISDLKKKFCFVSDYEDYLEQNGQKLFFIRTLTLTVIKNNDFLNSSYASATSHFHNSPKISPKTKSPNYRKRSSFAKNTEQKCSSGDSSPALDIVTGDDHPIEKDQEENLNRTPGSASLDRRGSQTAIAENNVGGEISSKNQAQSRNSKSNFSQYLGKNPLQNKILEGGEEKKELEVIMGTNSWTGGRENPLLNRTNTANPTPNNNTTVGPVVTSKNMSVLQNLKKEATGNNLASGKMSFSQKKEKKILMIKNPKKVNLEDRVVDCLEAEDCDETPNQYNKFRSFSYDEFVLKKQNILDPDKYVSYLHKKRKKVDQNFMNILCEVHHLLKGMTKLSYEKIILREIIKLIIEFLQTKLFKLKNGMCKQFIESSNNSHKTIIDRIASIKSKINIIRGVPFKHTDYTPSSRTISGRSIHSAVLPATNFRNIHSEERINSPLDLLSLRNKNSSFESFRAANSSFSSISEIQGQTISPLKMRPHSRAMKHMSESPIEKPVPSETPMVNIDNKCDPAELQQHLIDLKKLNLINKILIKVKYLFANIAYLFHYEDIAFGFLKSKKPSENSPLKWMVSPSISPSREGQQSTDYSPMYIPDRSISPNNNKRMISSDEKNLMTDELALKKILFQVDQNFEIEDKKENKRILKIIRKIDELPRNSDKFEEMLLCTKGKLSELDPVFREKKTAMLEKYLIWKMKKWNALWKKENNEAKKKSFILSFDREKVVCRICEREVIKKNISEHSTLCKEKEESRFELKKNLNELAGFMTWVLGLNRSHSIQNTVLRKKISQLEKRSSNSIEQGVSHAVIPSNNNVNLREILEDKEMDEEFHHQSDDELRLSKVNSDDIHFAFSRGFGSLKERMGNKRIGSLTVVGPMTRELHRSQNKISAFMKYKGNRDNLMNDQQNGAMITELNTECSIDRSILAKPESKNIIEASKNSISSFKPQKDPRKASSSLSSSSTSSDTSSSQSSSESNSDTSIGQKTKMSKNVEVKVVQRRNPNRNRSMFINNGERPARRGTVNLTRNEMETLNNKLEILKKSAIVKANKLVMELSETLQILIKKISQETIPAKVQLYIKDSMSQIDALRAKLNGSGVQNLEEIFKKIDDIQQIASNFLKNLMKITLLEKDLDLLHSGKKPTVKLHFKNNLENGEINTTPNNQQSRFSDLDSLTKKSNSYLGEPNVSFSEKLSIDVIVREAGVERKGSCDTMKPKRIPSKLSNPLASLTDNESSSMSDQAEESEKSEGNMTPDRRKLSLKMSTSLDKGIRRKSFASSKIKQKPLLQLERVEITKESSAEERKRLIKELIDGVGVCMYTFLLPAGKKYFSDTEASSIILYKEKKNPLQKTNDEDNIVSYFSDTITEHNTKDEELKNKEADSAIKITDFEFLKLISKGAYGRVWLVKRKSTNDIYAMKIVNYAEKMTKNHLDSLKKENQIFGVVRGDFVVKAVFTFIHENYICFVMEYMYGGDLGSLLEKCTAFDETWARFYISEIILATEYLHGLGIIHRDLKPDNMLLDSRGHIKLTDFGLSDMGFVISKEKKQALKIPFFHEDEGDSEEGSGEKRLGKFKTMKNLKFNPSKRNSEKRPTLVSSKLKLNTSDDIPSNFDEIKRKKPAPLKKMQRIIGTPDYMAPEILKGEGLQNPVIDWWSVGIILFEFLTGVPPFNDDTQELVFENIKNLRIPWDKIDIGYEEDCMSPEAEELIRSLLEPDPKKRLGIRGAGEIKRHRFFKGIEWENIRNLEAPYVPKIADIIDTSNFDKQKKYEEGEKNDPFFAGSSPDSLQKVSEAKKLLGYDTFSLKRVDLLHEENTKKIAEEEEKRENLDKENLEIEQELLKLRMNKEYESYMEVDDDVNNPRFSN